MIRKPSDEHRSVNLESVEPKTSSGLKHVGEDLDINEVVKGELV